MRDVFYLHVIDVIDWLMRYQLFISVRDESILTSKLKG